MPKSKKGGGSSRGDKQLSSRTKKQIDSLPEHAQHIYKKAHSNALEQYQSAEKRRGGKKQSAEEVAHKTAGRLSKKNTRKREMNG